MRRRPLARLSHALALLVLLAAVPARAAWVPDGTRVSPLPPEYDAYHLVGALADGQGGATMAWLHTTEIIPADYYVYRIEAQRIDRDGNVVAGWPAGGVVLLSWNLMNMTGLFAAEVIGVVPDGVGGTYVVTRESALYGDYVDYARAFRVSPAGTFQAVGSSLYGLVGAVTAAVDADGASGLVFVAKGRGHAPPPDPRPELPVIVQRCDSLGTPLWPGTALVPVGQADAGLGLAIARDGAGGAFVAWVDRRDVSSGSPDPDLYLQHVLADGSFDPAWPAQGLLVCGAVGLQTLPALRSDGSGGVYAVWYDHRGANRALYVADVRGDGTFAPGTPVDGRPVGEVDDSARDRIALEPDGLGGLYLLRATRGSALTRRVVLHRLAGDGQPQPGWPMEGLELDPRAPGFYDAGALAVDDVHGVFAAFTIPNTSPAQDLLVNEIDANGQPAPGWATAPQVLSPSAGATWSVDAITATRSDAGAIVAWNDSRHAPDAYWGQSVYAQRVLPDGPVPVTASLVAAEASPDEVRLRWSLALDAPTAVTLERRTEATPWVGLTSRTVYDTDPVEFTDDAIEPGARYQYRLTWSEGGSTRASNGVWVDVPAAFRLALEALPNPADRATTLRFALAREAQGRLVIRDLAGRRVRLLAAGRFAPGTTVRIWDLEDDAGRAVPAGLYLARWETAEGAITRKVAVAR